MAFTVTTIIENHSDDPRLEAQYGLSMYLTDGSFSLLLDTGADGTFLKNAETLGIKFDNLDTLVLSHGHSDHAGGVKALVESGIRPRETYVGENFFVPRYKRESGRLRPISAKVSEEYLMDNGVNYYVIEPGIHRLHEKVYMVNGIPAANSFETPNELLLCRIGREYVTDPFTEETVIVVEGAEGLAILSGCCHSGVLNTCEWISKLFERPIHTFIGGTHLMESDESRICETMRRLDLMGVRRMGACHCHGALATQLFSERYRGYFDNGCGSCIAL